MKSIIDSRQLLTFTALARRGSFTLAAKDLLLTQSAVSHAIKSLEEELGARLFDRAGRRVLVTQAGQQFLRHAERIIREMEEARCGLDALGKSGQGRLRVGATTTGCQHVLPSVLREFRRAFPHCVVAIEPGDQRRLLELVRGNQVDVAIMLESAGQADLAFLPLFQDELRFVVAPVHPWARTSRVPREAIAAETLVLPDRRSCAFELLRDYFREERLLLNNYIEVGSMEAIKELVKAGVGAGVLPPWIARAELDSGSLISLPLGPRRLRRKWGVAHLKGRRLALAEEAFVGMCRRVSGKLDSQPAAA